MSGHRQAAVALYGLAPGDQQGILAELPERDRHLLVEYLAELAALGFDKAVNAAGELDGQAGAPVAAAPSPMASQAAASPRDRLRAAAAADVYAVLAQESPILIAQVLAIETWPWTPALLDLAGAAHSARIRDALDNVVANAPARTRFLIAALDDQLAVGTPPTRAGTPRIAGILRKWTSWIR